MPRRRKCQDCRELYEPVRRLHAQGLPDRLIAQRLGLSHDKVKEIRRLRLELPTIPDIDGKRAAVRKQLATLGLSSPTELRTRAFRRYAAECGWPEHLCPREVQILNVLAARGPMTMRELAEAIGMRTDRIGGNGRPALLTSGCRRGTRSSRGTYTAMLRAEGLVVYLPRYQKGRPHGHARREGYYMLSAEAIATLERSSHGQKLQPAQAQ